MWGKRTELVFEGEKKPLGSINKLLTFFRLLKVIFLLYCLSYEFTKKTPAVLDSKDKGKCYSPSWGQRGKIFFLL